MTKLIFLALLLFMTLALPHAGWAADVTPFKECATLVNSANQQVMGVIKTESYMFKGQVLRHEKNFNLQDGETVAVCSTGPFFPGYKVELTIRTIMPLFNCQTRLSGNIYLRSKWDDENGVQILYADCK
jgi:hypothetical protein